MRALKVTVTTVLLAAAAFAQTSSPDSQLTQTLITEIRQLRQDLQATAAVIQRVQILMYRLQMESGLLTRATQRLDDARSRCSQSQSQLKNMTSQIEQVEARLRATQNPAEQKSSEDMLARLKPTLSMWTNEEQQCHPREIDAQAQVQSAQARVDDFQSQLDKLDKLLAGVAAK
jgi:chromosome segregation ATPase